MMLAIKNIYCCWLKFQTQDLHSTAQFNILDITLFELILIYTSNIFGGSIRLFVLVCDCSVFVQRDPKLGKSYTTDSRSTVQHG